ncbi:MAG: tetratricopeptide repeat protein [Candidatus Sabulitectum sp.]|nr:tetratricopeptide repeat protein [Candidatus Sabulitectum sp.]
MYKLVVPILILLMGGCAYYNTFYNARSSYEEAFEYAREHPDDPAQHEKTLLDNAIAGAGRVLARHPESRWVDDAQLLLGNALLLRGQRSLVGSGTSDFQEAMMSFASVIVMTDNQSLLDRARLGQGKAAIELGRFHDAAAALLEVSSENNRRHALSRLLLCEAYLESGQPELAASVFDTLAPSGGDSLKAEYYITGGEILTALGMPDSGAVMCLRATAIEERGEVFYRALVTAAELYVEAGMPEKASQELNRLLLGYRSDREMADISLLKGRADELAGDTDGALTAYLDAAELDSYRETGAEALYRRAVLLEQGERYDEALLALGECASRSGNFMWLRLAANRERNLNLFIVYSDSANTAGGVDKVHYSLLAAEKRLDLYGMDSAALEGFRQVVDSDHILFSSMALVFLVDNGGISADSTEMVLLSVLNRIPESDLAGRIEERLGLPPGNTASARPSAVLERAWAQIEIQEWESAWSGLDNLLESPFGYEVRAEALWVAYVASEGARMDDGIVSGYLKELTDEYPETPQGKEAALRRAVGLEEEDPEDDEE